MKTLRQELKQPKKLDLNLLSVFSQVYNTGSVNCAATALEISASSVSHHLNKLRDFFSDPLFVREGLRLAATPVAREIHELLYEDFDRLMRALNGISDVGMMDKIVLHSTPYLSMRTVPELAHILWNDNSRCEVFHKISQTATGVLFDGEIRFRVAEIFLDIKPDSNRSMNNVKIFEEELCFVCSMNHPRIEEIMTKEMAKTEQFALFENSIDDFEINEVVGKHTRKFQSNSFFALLSLIESSEYISVMPVWLFEKLKAAFSIKRISSNYHLSPLPVYLIYSKKHISENIVNAITQHFQDS